MTLPVRRDGRLDYASVERELRTRMILCGLWDVPEKMRTELVHQLYWWKVWSWILFGLSMVVGLWVLW